MPLYEYQCRKCGHRFERIQKYSDPPSKKCPDCGGKVDQLISSPAVHFKGSGFYVTDYGRKGSPTGDSGGSSKEGGAGDDSSAGKAREGSKTETSSSSSGREGSSEGGRSRPQDSERAKSRDREESRSKSSEKKSPRK